MFSEPSANNVSANNIRDYLRVFLQMAVVLTYGAALPGQVISPSNLITITDPGNVGYQNLELWDSDGTAATGQFKINGVAQTGGHEIDVSQAVVNTSGAVVFDEGTTGNTDTLRARLLQNDGTLTPWQQFTLVDPLTVEQGATLELSTAYSWTVHFAGSSGTLQLDNSASFNGTVVGMTAVARRIMQKNSAVWISAGKGQLPRTLRRLP